MAHLGTIPKTGNRFSEKAPPRTWSVTISEAEIITL
jgi:hypothetical protein